MIRAAIIIVLLTSTVNAGGPASRRKRTSVRVARAYSRPAVIAARNAGGRPWAWSAYYTSRAAFNVSRPFSPLSWIGGLL